MVETAEGRMAGWVVSGLIPWLTERSLDLLAGGLLAVVIFSQGTGYPTQTGLEGFQTALFLTLIFIVASGFAISTLLAAIMWPNPRPFERARTNALLFALHFTGFPILTDVISRKHLDAFTWQMCMLLALGAIAVFVSTMGVRTAFRGRVG